MSKTDLQIFSPRQGISQSPHVGFSDMRNLNINDIPGVVTLNNLQVKVSGVVVTDRINWIVRHPITTAEIYALGNTGNVYKSADSGATWALMTGFTAGGHGNGMIIWKNYLLVARDAYIDVCGDGTATGIANGAWSNSWQAIDSDVLWHPMLVSKNDNKVYGGAGKYVFSLEELTTFAPGTGSTFTWTQQALDLPPAYRIKCIEELGNNLILGTWQGTNLYDMRVADIFPWDRSSVSFGQPTTIDDYGVHAMKNEGNFITVLAGTSGTIRRYDGSNCYIIGQIPTDLSGGKYIEWYPNSLMNYKNKSFFGTGNATAISNQGIYSLLQTGKGNILNLEHINSSGFDGTNFSSRNTALLPVTRDTMLAGWSTSNVMTMTIADPCVVTLASHGFADGTPILFTTTNTLPTGITASTYYYTRSTGTNTFNLYDTSAHAITGGATGRVVSTGSQAGVHTGETHGIDLTTATSYSTSYSAYFTTPLYTVGSVNNLDKFKDIEFQLSRPLRTGEGIRIAYREELTSDFTTVVTHDYTTWGAVVSHNTIFSVPTKNIPSCEQLQLRIYLTGSATTPELKSVTLKR
jgi:hypothetical protein